MNQLPLNRRSMLGTTAAAMLVGSAQVSSAAPSRRSSLTETTAMSETSTFKFCLNTSTIRGQKKPLDEEIDIAAKVGYDAVEPWVREIQQFQDGGGKLSDLRKRIADHGLEVASAIGFSNWIADDAQQRAKALEQAKREMELVKSLGGSRIAAPPAGGTKEPVDLDAAAQRYRALLVAAESIGVEPQLELWGFSKTLSRLGELAYVAIEAGHPDAAVLPDVYHIYKGGSDFAGLKLLSGTAMHVFHVNDYPADPPRESIGDADRVFPGDGVAPLSSILQMLEQNQFNGYLSLELFNRSYWKEDPTQVCQTGLEKMKRAVATAKA